MNESDISQRWFDLDGESPEPEILGLLRAAHALDDPALAAEASRLARLQIRQRFGAGKACERTVRTRVGIRFTIDAADSFAAGVYAGWLKEADEFEVFMNLIAPGDLVIDVGANFGLYTLHAARYCGMAGAVIAYEPAPSAFKLLEANIAANDTAGSVSARRAAISDRVGKGRLHVASDVSFSGLTDTGRSPKLKTVNVELVTLDSEPLLAGRAAKVLKIDVEGHEHRVLKGAMGLIERSPDLIIQFEYSYKNSTPELDHELDEVLSQLQQLGFSLLRIGERELEAVTPLPSMASRYSGNLYLARAKSLPRLAAALAAARRNTWRPPPGFAVLLRHIGDQRGALEKSQGLEHTINEIADATVGPAPGELAGARIRALQSALLDARHQLAQIEAASSAEANNRQAIEEAHQAKLKGFTDALHAFEVRALDLTSQRDELRDKLDKTRVARDAEVEACEQQRQIAQDKLQSCRDAFAELEAQNASLRVERDSASARAESMRFARDQLQASFVAACDSEAKANEAARLAAEALVEARHAEAAAREEGKALDAKRLELIEALQLEAKNREETLNKLSGKLQSYRESLASMEKRIEVLGAERDGAIAKVEALRVSRDKTHEAAAKGLGERKALLAQLDEARTAMEGLQQQLADLQEERVHEKIGREALKTQLCEARAASEALQLQVSTLQQDRARGLAEQEALNAQLGEARDLNEALQRQVLGLQKDQAQARAERDAMTARVEELIAARVGCEDRLADLQARYDALQNQANRLRDEAEGQNAALTALLLRKEQDFAAVYNALELEVERGAAQAALLDTIYRRFSLIPGVLPRREQAPKKNAEVPDESGQNRQDHLAL